MRRRLDPAPALAAPPAEAVSSDSTIMACRRFAPADTASGSGIASASVGAGEDGRGGNAVNVNGDSGVIGNGCIVEGMAAEGCGFSFACRDDANARGLGVLAGGAVEGSGRAVVAGGEGGADGDVVGAVVIGCDNLAGARGPYGKERIAFRIPTVHERQV